MPDENKIVIPTDVRLILTEAYLRRHSGLSVQAVAQQEVDRWAKREGKVAGTARIDRDYERPLWYVTATACKAVPGIDRDTIDRLTDLSGPIHIVYSEVPTDA